MGASASIQGDDLIVTQKGASETVPIKEIRDTFFTFRGTMGGTMFVKLHSRRIIRLRWNDWSGDAARAFRSQLEAHPSYSPDHSFMTARSRAVWVTVLVFALCLIVLSLLAKYQG
jgi:hypothetical protein